MNLKSMRYAFSLIAAAVTASGALAHAASPTVPNDAVADAARAKITLMQAVAAAEAHTRGKATKAELEDEHGAVVYEVEVIAADKGVLDVTVDAVNGKVLSSKADKVDLRETVDEAGEK